MRTPVHLAAAALAVGVAPGCGTAPANVSIVQPDELTHVRHVRLHQLRDTAPANVSIVQPDCPLPPVEVSSGAFGVGLLATVSEGGTRNALVSPLGIGAVLEMVASGAKLPVRRSIREMLDMGGGSPERTETGTDGTSSAGSDDAEPVDDSDAGGSSTGGSDTGGSAAGDSHGDGPDGSGESGWLSSCRLQWVVYDASGDAVKVQVANGAFADRRLDLFPAYSEVLRDRFDARVERLDFEDERSVGRINAWVSESTGGAIPHLISQLDPDDALVLANAMRFEGEWTQRFDPERTAPAPFHLRSGAAPEIPTMHAEYLPAWYREDGDFQAVALPYGEGRFEFVAVLPRAGLEASEALRRLAADPSWLGRRGFRLSRGTLALPRLALDAEASLLPALRTLGLGAALDDPQAFEGIAAPAPELSGVLHRTMLELDEQGTVAVAVTMIFMRPTSTMVEEERSFEMRVDRPFALAVRHHGTGAVLFAAWVDDPTAGGR